MYNKNIRVHLIDTPGFDDTDRSDVQVLQDIAHWLSHSFQHGLRLSGLIFMHRISDPKMAGSAKRNLMMFKKLCGEKAYQSVILATSMWSKGKPEEGAKREKELMDTDEFWGLMCKRGSTVFRYTDSRESALEIITYILELHMTVTLDIQDEIVNQGHNIDETSAAHVLNAEMIRERKKHMEALKDMQDSMQDAIEQHDKDLQEQFKQEIDTLQEKMKKGEEEQQKLKQTLQEVDKRKEEEFRAFRKQMQEEREQERQRYENERAELRASMTRQEEALKEQHRREMERMERENAAREQMARKEEERREEARKEQHRRETERDNAAREQMARKQKELQKDMQRQRMEDKRRMDEIEEKHRKKQEEWDARERRSNSECLCVYMKKFAVTDDCRRRYLEEGSRFLLRLREVLS
jgi:hypothetical protein